MARRIMIVDTPEGDLQELARTIKKAANNDSVIETVENFSDAIDALRSGLAYDLVVLDYDLGDGSTHGRKILKDVRKINPIIPVVAVAEHGNVENANAAIKDGATDFLVRGGLLTKRVSTLLGKVRNILDLLEQNRALGEQYRMIREADRARHRIIGESPQIREVIERIDRVGAIPRPVLILGERGTGKELVARAIHEAAGEGTRPFVAVNCAAFSDTLLESELFGHERGAFTGAENTVHGKFEQAAGGTLFMDEIGNMSLPFQQKILRVVEYGAFTRVGGREEIRTNARIITATNAPLQKKMQTGVFMRDLYDRISFEVIKVPPLREREGDIEILARHFLQEFMREIPALGGKRLAQSAIRAMKNYPFPGNVRELKNVIERAAYRDTTNEITPEDIGMLSSSEMLNPVDSGGADFEERVENFKRRLILGALDAAVGNQAQAARTLGLGYHQYRYYLRKYNKEHLQV